MDITAASPADTGHALRCWTTAFAADPITGFLLGTGPGYPERLNRFFDLLVRARLRLGMPVLVARDAGGTHGAVMGNSATPPPWPEELEDEWGRLEALAPGFDDRAATYDGIAEAGKPSVPHYYLGVIGVDPAMHGRGIGARLLRSFCDLSAANPASGGVYLETANPANVPFYERAGFAVTAEGRLGSATLWCLFLRHERGGGTGSRGAGATGP